MNYAHSAIDNHLQYTVFNSKCRTEDLETSPNVREEHEEAPTIIIAVLSSACGTQAH